MSPGGPAIRGAREHARSAKRRALVSLAALALFACASPAVDVASADARGGRPPQDVAPRSASSASPAAESESASAAVTGARVRVLGIAQDGGIPHAACTCPRCQAARELPSRREYVASLGLVLPSRTLLVDATPDLRAQLDMLADVGARGQGAARGGVDRHPVDGVLLTHAHIGHYLGLAFFGFEAIHTSRLTVHASPAMGAFLTKHAPWAQLVALENLALAPIAAGERVALGDDVYVTALSVPHRDEYADTLAYRIEGPRARVLYLPDCDPWARWPADNDPRALFDAVDVALVDGSFYSGDELPGRDLAKIGHPLMTETMELLASRVASGRLRVRFVHLNHSNPALDPASPARRELESRGFAVARTGEELPL